MAIVLEKGQRVSLGLVKVGIGLGWDPNDSSGKDYDLDASIFLLGSSGKLPADEFFVFYNNQESPDHAVRSSGDDRTGGNSDGDDETLFIEFDRLDPRIVEMIVVVTIHEAHERRQNFGQVRNSFIRVFDAQTDEEICKYELDEDFSVETAVEFGRLYLKDGSWRFEAVGKGYTQGLQHFVDKYA
jgi:tellurium resistance protein TerD